MYYRGRNKYGATKVVYDGITFDSKHEAQRYQELKLLESQGIISQLQLQVEYRLIPEQRAEGKMITKGPNKGKYKPGKLIEKACDYVADFKYYDNELNEWIIEDTKGFRTRDYVIKRKLMLWLYGIRVVEV